LAILHSPFFISPDEDFMKPSLYSVFTLVALVEPLSAAEPIAPSQFDKLHALIRPGDQEERWQQIPWGADLWEARKQAAREGKPILLWEMDGHPLGCV
jgi:hypothetical protein